MNARTYSSSSFISTLADRTQTYVLLIQTDGFGASSLRYLDITGIPEEARDELRENNIAFVTYTDRQEAIQAIETLVANWPEQSQTTLGIFAALGVPGENNREFQQYPGGECFNTIAG